MKKKLKNRYIYVMMDDKGYYPIKNSQPDRNNLTKDISKTMTYKSEFAIGMELPIANVRYNHLFKTIFRIKKILVKE